MSPVRASTIQRRIPVLYLDIDGTVRHSLDELGHFVNKPEEVVIYPEVPNLLQIYKAYGWRIIGVSNQGGIALGHLSMRDCALAMAETNRQVGNLFDKMSWCSHHPEAETPEMAVCWCRKPRVGGALDAVFSLAAETQAAGRPEIYPPHMALFVGDRPEDEETARNLNVEFMPASIWRRGQHAARLR